MGKVKTVIMGDELAEEAARKKVEAKREGKKAEKKAKTLKTETEKLPVLGSQLSEQGLPAISQPVSETQDETEKPTTDKPKSDNRKLKTDNRYQFLPGKKYSAAKSLVDSQKTYSLSEAITLVKKTSYSKFDGSVEVHINVTDKNLRGTTTLPHTTGKQVKVAIADDNLINSINSGGSINFDILVASPDMMPKLAKIAKILGPRGLMPNPKTNTISENPSQLVKILSSSYQWKTQPDFPIVHAVIGKVSFEDKKLAENFAALTKSIRKDKIKTIFLKATMGPSIKLEV